MDVTLPNGYVIKGVPDGTPKEMIMQKAIAAGFATEADFQEGAKAYAMPDEVQANEFQAENLPERPVTYKDRFRSALNDLYSGATATAEVAATAASGAVAEPVAGLAGMADYMRPDDSMPLQQRQAELMQGRIPPIVRPTTINERSQTVETTRDQLTRQPQTPEGKNALQSIAQFIEPGTEAWAAVERHLGDTAFDITGSPMFATIMRTVPTALLEVLGIGVGKGVGTSLARRPGKRMDAEIDKNIKGAIPSQEVLKATSTQHFKELDKLNVVVKPDVYAKLVDDIELSLRKGGMDSRVTPEAANALQAMKDTLESGKPITLSEVEVLREIATNAIDPINKNKARLAMNIVDGIDDFLERVDPKQLDFPAGVQPGEIGVKYRLAREQWGRYRRSEMLDKAVAKAASQASGFENGIRIQFRQILANEKKSKFFTESELDAMRSVESGSHTGNLFKTLGKAGIDLGKGNTGGLAAVIGGGILVSGGDVLTALGTIGAASVFKNLATRMTLRGAKFANEIIRAGKDARKITEIYIRNTPVNKRSANELSLLLLDKDIDLTPLKKFKMEAEAAKLAIERRGMLAGSVAPTMTDSVNDEAETRQ